MDKRGKSLLIFLQLIILFSSTFALSLSLSSQDVQAAEVCCSETTSGNYCDYVEQSECKTGAQSAPTSCDQTSFCKPSCCPAEDGFCYDNYPKALCSSPEVGGRPQDGACSQVSECNLGCCLIGTQALFTTKTNCIAQTGSYGDLEVDFRTSVTTEQACVNLAQTADTGCCVTQDGCKFTSKAECTIDQAVTGTGFYKDKYCSQLPSQCDCAPSNPESIGANNRRGTEDPKQTMCLDNSDDVYWKDSCGNPEGIKEKCNYAEGTICGDSDENGEYTCESVDCINSDDKTFTFNSKIAQPGKISPQLEDGRTSIKNGESWCLWDYQDAESAKNYYGKSPVGATDYRALCINGQQLIEPCADFRKEFCFSTDVNAPGVTATSDEEFISGRCLKNDRWESCVNDCNTADPYSMNKKEYKEAIEKDTTCCSDISQRDCQWAGKCVPAVSPGYKFWEGEGTDTCSKANTECTATFVCAGWDSVLGICDPEDWDSRFLKGAVLTTVGGLVSGFLAGGPVGGAAAATAIGIQLLASESHPTDAAGGWQLVSGGECFSKDYLQASNNYCRSLGDCGADVNYLGDLSYAGFSNTESINDELTSALKYEGVSGIVDQVDRVGSKLGRAKFDKAELKNSLSYLNDEFDEHKFKDGTIDDRSEREIPGKLEKPDWGRGQEFFNFSINNKDEYEGFGGFFWNFFGRDNWIAGAVAYGGLPITVGAGVFFANIPLKVASSAAIRTFPLAEGITQLIGLSKDSGAKEFLKLSTDPVAYDVANNIAIETAKSEATADTVSSLFTKKLSEAGLTEVNVISITPNHYTVSWAGVDPSTYSYEQMIKTINAENPSNFAENAIKDATDKAVADATSKVSTSLLPQIVSGASWGMWIFTGYKILDVVMQDTKTVTISTTCSPWQALPVTKEDQCERCNPTSSDYVDSNNNPTDIMAFKKCTEYRCKSLGATCELINKGTDKETCVSLYKYDIKPPVITPFKEAFSENIQELPYRAFRTSDGLEAFEVGVKDGTDQQKIGIYERFNIAIKTDKPSQCKMSFTSGKTYEEMSNIYFGTNLYETVHLQNMFYPSSKAEETDTPSSSTSVTSTPDSLKLTGGGEYNVYVKCQDANGNANINDYLIRFYVSDSPDLTAPNIITTSFAEQEVYIKNGVTQIDSLSLFVNEPATCRYSTSPLAYKDMDATQQCVNNGVPAPLGYYECIFDGAIGHGPQITGLESKAGERKFLYFKCEDRNKNFNKEPYKITLLGSDPLKIDTVSTEPPISDGEIKTSLAAIPVKLKVKTSAGAKLNGEAICKYTENEALKNSYANMGAEFFTTGTNNHEQTFDSLSSGDHTFYVGCEDKAGNQDFNQISFKLQSDISAPFIVRAYKDTNLQPSVFKIETNEEATCKDSTSPISDYETQGNLMTKEGTNTHVSSTEPSNLYYVLCKDTFENVMTNPAVIQFT